MNDHSSPWMDHRDELLERVVRNGRARKRQRRAFGVTAAVMVLVVAIGAGLYLPGHGTSSLHVAPPGPQATTTTVVPGPPPGVFLVGDSVMLGAKAALEHAIPDARVDAGVSRQFADGIPILENEEKLGELPQTVVVYLGTNGRIADGDFDRIMAGVGPQRTVYFLTVNVPRPWEFDVNNALSNGATRWPNAHVLDWKDHTRGHSSWFLADGFHLAPAGQTAFAEFVSSGIRTSPAPTADPFSGSAIPATGFVVMDDPKVDQPQGPSSWALTLFDDSGHELGTLPRATVGDDVLNAQRHVLVADGNGVHLAAQPLDTGSDLPDGCTQTEQVHDLAVALCGSRSGDQLLGDRIIVNPGNGWIPLIGKPPVKGGVQSTGEWEWVSPSPDGRWVLAGWSAECEVVTELMISVADGSVRAVTGEAGTAWTDAPESGGLGWAADGSAIAAFGGGDTGCGTQAPVQRGLYLVSPATGTRRLLLALTPSQQVLRWDAVDDQRTRPQVAGSPLRVDLDGDGHPDQLSIASPTGTTPSSMIATLADGRVITGVFPASASAQILGAADIAHDGRHEVFVHTGGETWSLGEIVVLGGDELSVTPNDTNGPSPLGWGQHSNSSPGGTADVACLVVDSHPSLVVTQSVVTQQTRQWRRSVYTLSGVTLKVEHHDRGTFAVDATPPSDLPLANHLDCGPVHA